MITNSDAVKPTGLYAYFLLDGKVVNLPIFTSLAHGLVVEIREKMHVVCDWDIKYSKGSLYLGNGETTWFIIKESA